MTNEEHKKMNKTREEVETICGDCGKWRSKANIILCGACFHIMKEGYIQEGKAQSKEQIDKEIRIRNAQLALKDLQFADWLENLFESEDSNFFKPDIMSVKELMKDKIKELRGKE